MPEYEIYGLRLRSRAAIDALVEADATGAVDIDVVLGDEAPAPTPRGALQPYARTGAERTSGLVVTRDDSGSLWFAYADGTQFVVDGEARRIQGWWPPTSSRADALTYLLGPILGFALRRRGVLALHASAVVLDGRAVALLGPGGAGKSTLAASFAAAGVPVLSDDVVAVREVRGTWMAYPAYRLIRLWDESTQLLFGAGDALPLLTPNWDKRGLALDGNYPFHIAPVALGDIIVLGARSSDSSAPTARAMSGVEALSAIVANSYTNYLLDEDMQRAELPLIGRMLAGRRVSEATPHAHLDRVPELVALVRRLSKG